MHGFPLRGRRLSRALLGICCSVAICGCTGSEGGPEIAFAFQDLETGFWVAAHKFIVESLEERGATVLEYNANEDPIRQLDQVRSAIGRGADGIVLIPQDGESALRIVEEANEAGVPIAVFNRPPADRSRPAIAVVADNERIAEEAVDFLVAEALEREGRSTPLIMVGDLGDPNAVARRKGFYNALAKHPEEFTVPVEEALEVPTKWDATTARANLQAILQAHPEVDFLFTSSDFMYPQIRAVLEPSGKWKRWGEDGHVILGGLDGDVEACRLMREGYVDATGVQDVIYEAKALLDALFAAMERGERRPEKWMEDPGFALTRRNFQERAMDMWGCKLSGE